MGRTPYPTAIKRRLRQARQASGPHYEPTVLGEGRRDLPTPATGDTATRAMKKPILADRAGQIANRIMPCFVEGMADTTEATTGCAGGQDRQDLASGQYGARSTGDLG
jgi:hypothetical protein